MIVNKWLFIYVHKDIYENVYRNNDIAKVMTIFLSAAVHELIVTTSTRIFFPVLFLMFFIPGVMGNWFKVKNANVSHILWTLSFFLGSGVVMTSYSIEFSAEYYLPTTKDEIVPRILSLIAGYERC